MSDDNQLVTTEEKAPASIVSANAKQVAKQYRVVRFRGRPMVLLHEPYPHFEPLHREAFDRIGYPLLGGVSRGRMGDVFSYLGNTAEDLSNNDHYILFGTTDVDKDGDRKGLATVWDTKSLSTVDVPPSQTVWRSPYFKIGSKDPTKPEPVEFVMQLAGGRQEVYDDIMQSIAPLIMDKKPDGVIWWVGDGANGKSTLMDALYKIFPGQLSSITVKRLTDGRDTPSLNGTLGNIVKESSEGRIDDTEIYKSIGTHEDFRVHKFHSQDDIGVIGNVHHIFNANTIPSFNDKGFSARRRTFIVPFNQRFESDPTFEERTFTDEMFGRLIMEMCVYANRIKRQGYRYKWSAVTLAAKAEYDTEANNAEEYAKHIIDEGVVGFESFNPLRQDYENWCAESGYVPLGIGNLRRALQTLGFERLSYRRDDGTTDKRYRLPMIADEDLVPLNSGRPGMYSVRGFQPKDQEDLSETEVETETEPEEPKPKQTSILDGKW